MTFGHPCPVSDLFGPPCFDDPDAPVERVGMAEVRQPYAKETLETAAMPNEDRIAAAALSVVA
jgi:pyruvate dehydrogenase E1 component beta subunit